MWVHRRCSGITRAQYSESWTCPPCALGVRETATAALAAAQPPQTQTRDPTTASTLTIPTTPMTTTSSMQALTTPQSSTSHPVLPSITTPPHLRSASPHRPLPHPTQPLPLLPHLMQPTPNSPPLSHICSICSKTIPRHPRHLPLNCSRCNNPAHITCAGLRKAGAHLRATWLCSTCSPACSLSPLHISSPPQPQPPTPPAHPPTPPMTHTPTPLTSRRKCPICNRTVPHNPTHNPLTCSSCHIVAHITCAGLRGAPLHRRSEWICPNCLADPLQNPSPQPPLPTFFPSPTPFLLPPSS